MNHRRLILGLAVALVTGAALAQRFGGRGSRSGYDGIRTARELESGSTGTPMWTNDVAFEKDAWTFARVRYGSGYGGYRFSRGGGWAVDIPDSDLNLSWRVQQMTSMKVDPDGRIVELSDSDLHKYPWLYFVEPGALRFTDEEVVAFRKYLLNGGFAMFDDFWGDSALMNVLNEMKRVFPEREFVELDMDHPIFHAVFDLKLTKNQMQVPNIRTGHESQWTGITWEQYHDGDNRNVHFKAIFDDKGRPMAFIAHNTDNGDGWEREGESEYYFKEFSEKKAYPLGINLLFYVMTH
ncbi:MAG: DUF4159 domain-containing protein [Verrucomicrobia bacterium]|nr:DUF4159 domain-containing protein [Verrucomicrobiota bacterium]